MAHLFIPLYNAEKLNFSFNTNPKVNFEAWNRQIKQIQMFPEEKEVIPDAIAIFEGDINAGNALEELDRLGLDILPLIFEKAYYADSVANCDSIIHRQRTTFAIPHEGQKWIKDEKLQSFLDIATNSIVKDNDLNILLKIRYEADFCASSMEVKYFLYWYIIHKMAKRFCNGIENSPISSATLKNMLRLAEKDIKNNSMIPDDKKIEKINLVKSNLKYRLNEKSHREIITEFLSNGCHLKIENLDIKKMVTIHGVLSKDIKPEYDKDYHLIFSHVEYVSRLVLIIALLGFEPGFSKYLPIRNYRPQLFEWDI